MWGRWIALAAVVALSGGCDTLSKGPYAQANVQGGEGSRVWGRVTFHQPEGGTFIGEGTSYKAPVASAAANASTGKVYVRIDINGLPSNRKFGFHVHEKGDCSGDFSGAGGHFNPGASRMDRRIRLTIMPATCPISSPTAKALPTGLLLPIS